MEFPQVGYIHKGAFIPGKLKLRSDGMVFKSSKNSDAVMIPDHDIEALQWLHAARGYELKVVHHKGSITKFDGFKESDYAELKEVVSSSYHKELPEVELCVKGWNWGEANVQGALLSFLVDSKPAFEIPLKEVSQVTSGKNELTLGFHQSEEAPVSLVEMRFHIPNVEGETDPVQDLHDKCLARADVIQATGDAIVIFPEIQTLTPRGRYSVKQYPTFLQLHGKTFDYKIPYGTISRLFLLPHNDQRQVFFVLSLDPPIRQGQTRYYFVIFLLSKEEECSVTLTLTEEELQERYDGRLARELSGRLFEVFSRVMRIVVDKRITVPGSFKTNNELCAVPCSCKATSGFLYPLDKGFIFVHKPAVFITFDAIASVNFARMSGNAGVSRSFDFEVDLKDGAVHHFSSLMKQDYGRLYNFVTEKKLRVRNKSKQQEKTVRYDEGGSSDSEHDAYLERMKAEGEERDSEDEDSDFVAGGSGSDDDLEYDSTAAPSESDGEEGDTEADDQPRAKKRKKDASKVGKPAKKQKLEEGSGGGRKKKQRAKKDPNAPKKPLSAYMLWLQDNRAAIKEEYPGISMTDVSKKAGEKWKKLGDKSHWDEAARAAKRTYTRQMEEFKAGNYSRPEPRKKSSPSTPASRGSKKSPKKTKAGSGPKSAEFVVDTDEEEEDDNQKKSSEESDASSGDESTKGVATRGRQGDGGGLVSLPSGSESDADLTSSNEEGGDDDESD